MMIFNNTHKVPVYVSEWKQADYISAKEGTIIIDNILLEDKTEYRHRLTMTHECDHWIFHQNMFRVNEHQINLFNEIRETNIPCRGVDIDSNHFEKSFLSPLDGTSCQIF